MKDLIRALVELQKIDADIYRLRREKQEQPIIIENLKKELEGKKSELAALDGQTKDLQKKRKAVYFAGRKHIILKNGL